MRVTRKKERILSVIMALLLAVALPVGVPAIKAYAAGGTVYSCAVNRCYAHPVTGVIEDSGGESAYATGQGMVEGCIYGNGILEVTEEGAYYLTIRMSLMNYTSNHSFQVQNVGDSGWSVPSEMGVTGNGTDSNGTTGDICMRVPSENCVVRGTMYVNPMGRAVVFYLYPSDYREGNQTDMRATMVTGTSDGTEAATGGAGPEASAETPGASGGGSLGAGGSSLSSAKAGDKSSSSATSGKKLQSSITKAAKGGENTSFANKGDSALDSAEGLSLSTAKNKAGNVKEKKGAAASGNRIFQTALAVVVSGLILLGAAAGVVYVFRRNWKRWGGAEDDRE